MTRFVPNSAPFLGGNEWRYLQECLETGWVSTAGPFVARFEREIADYVGSRHAIATVSGTAALHVALLVAGVEPGDEVLVPALTFVATANAVRYCGASPVFMDCEEESWGMDGGKVRAFLEERCTVRDGSVIDGASGRVVRALLPVHLYGHPVSMGPLLEICASWPLVLVEDAAEALGARWEARAVGSLGAVGCLSFNGNKIMTCGGGGTVLTDDEALARRVRSLTTQARDDDAPFLHREVGYNYRMTNIAAALGVAQLEQLGRFIEAKRAIAGAYARALADLGGAEPLTEAPGTFSSYWMSAVLLDPSRFGPASDIVSRARGEGLEIRPLWHPLHRQPAFAGCEAYRIEVADRLHARGVCLPCSVGLEPEDQARVVEFLGRCAGSSR